MFSGIIEEIGNVLTVTDSSDGRKLTIRGRVALQDLRIGDSIAISGCCMTVVDFDEQSFSVEASHETLRRTKLGSFASGDKVNLERALKLSDRLGGHLVTGHIDAVGRVASIREDGFSKIVEFEMEKDWSPFFVAKGSVAVEGVSLTVANLIDSSDAFKFSVALIPHTLSVTTLGELVEGEAINIETDVVARYVARWLAPSLEAKTPASKIIKQLVNLGALRSSEDT